MYGLDNHDVRTEGMSYGMMITVELDKKAEFDAIWNWARRICTSLIPKAPSYQFFAWSCKTDGTHNSEGAAPDGESYFAMALSVCGESLGRSGRGFTTTMRRREIADSDGASGSDHRQAGGGEEHTVGPMMILSADDFVCAGYLRAVFTDPSYHLPAFYELWSRWGPAEDREFWAKAASASRSVLCEDDEPGNGPGAGLCKFRWYAARESVFRNRDEFGYDAWRTASNWAVDWSWWQKAPTEQELSDRIQKFFASQGIDKYGPVYTLDGKDLGPKPGHRQSSNGVGGDKRSYGTGSYRSRAGEGIHRGIVECARSVGAVSVLRRNALFDEPDARERGVSGVGAEVGE